ncbi:response regulator [Deinococcus yavapaiensis]|uniref:Response regulator receiver domain-containing protein n=1 Tax=Deinococcus yavapaiensis KR-236 TaxID=694435 RepID=A0A318S949_9DEIO|nr:response regulator [Deinococcus yavapaiensis]PYE52727.1 response regulator receiver domain-containing protein [Deinococcus yavapaiensis KR-236]
MNGETEAALGSPVVLVVDDNAADVDLTHEALADARPDVEMHEAATGSDALAFLRGPDGARVRLVLLDLNLPRVHGFDVLSALRALPELRALPVVVMTTSDADDDARRAAALAANAFLRKPIGFVEYSAMVRALLARWLPLVES